ncbi:MAG: tetratricopeptide repeat protein [Candidatus Marinimicrobia bacterium]|nr:tetratricopeptide repeat protein [Candidatus Neomarinimicrobiota bacterium]
MRRILIGLTLVAITFAQPVDEFIIRGKETIRTAIANWNEGEMIAARAYFERGLNFGEKEWLFRYYIAYADDQLVHYYQAKSDKKSALKYLNNGIDHLNEVIKLNKDFADGYGLLSSLYGEKMGIQPWTGIMYGSRSSTLIRKAIQLEPENPRLYMIQGTSSMFTPEKWGGSKERAKELYLKAAELFKSDNPSPLMPDWGKSDIYAWLGQLEEKFGNYDQAKAYYEQALVVDPENNWVKHQLMTRLTVKSARENR